MRGEPVTLYDGTVVDSYSEAWRHECEARAVLAFPTLRKRRAYLYGEFEDVRINNKWVRKTLSRGILQSRGEAECKRLEVTMKALWKLQRQAANDNYPR